MLPIGSDVIGEVEVDTEIGSDPAAPIHREAAGRGDRGPHKRPKAVYALDVLDGRIGKIIRIAACRRSQAAKKKKP